MLRASLLLLLAAAPATGLALKSGETDPVFDRAAEVEHVTNALARDGLRPSPGSRITVSGRTAGVVLESAGCDGVLIVLPLPPTAQRFENVVPGLPDRGTANGFAYHGKVSTAYPGWDRLLHRAAFALRLTDADAVPSHTVYAFRELGDCGLAHRADWRAL